MEAEKYEVLEKIGNFFEQPQVGHTDGAQAMDPSESSGKCDASLTDM